jgi:penicillin-binding protein activator
MNRLLLAVCMIFLLTGCATKVTRTDVNTVTDLSGGWNDTDVRLVAEEMIKDCMDGNWINDFNKATGRAPTVIIGSIRNKTFEHISAEMFTNHLEMALVDSGKVAFIADKSYRDEIRDERADQLTGNTEPSTIAEKGHETGADFMLQGSINSIKDAIKGKQSVFYQVKLELVDMRTNQKRWIGQKEIKKIVDRPSVRL